MTLMDKKFLVERKEDVGEIEVLRVSDVKGCFEEILKGIDDIIEYDDMTITACNEEIFEFIKQKVGNL